MSYQKLKNISIKDTTVFFQHKCNNDTEPFRDDSCDIPTFLHNSLGNIFQYTAKKLNETVKEFSGKLKDENSFWWNVENAGIDSEKISIEDRMLFYNYCDKIKSFGKN